MLDQTQELRRNERLRVQARVNPWDDVFEFESVGEALLLSAELWQNERIVQSKNNTTEVMRLEEALQQVDVWKSRTNALPHAIESTAAFARIILRDFQGTISSSELRLAYSSAILRTINGLADVLQQQRVHAASVTVLCHQLGIPSWLVGIRHESTHNQLPSLAVLRLSSKSLLHYFRQVYWDPLARAKLDHLNDANALLQAYHKTALQTGVMSEEPLEITEKEPLLNEQSDRNHQKSADTQLRSMMDLPFQSKLGTSFNSFAVLQSSSKKEKKKKPKRKPSASKKQKKQEEMNRVPISSGKPACLSFGQAFVKANVPLDILRYTLLSYLIWKGPEFDERSGGGVLFAETQDHLGVDSFDLLKQRYLPLIQAACRAWPGFLTTVLVHMIDASLSMEGIETESNTEDVLKKISFLEQWVSCLLSKDFLLQTFPTLGPELKSYKTDAAIQWYSLRSLQLPLNSLCDRCEEEGSANPSSSSKAIARLFQKMLGCDRVRHFGANLIHDATIMTNTIKHDNSVCQEEEKPTLLGVLSLEEIEKLLGDRGETLQAQHEAQRFVNSTMTVENHVEAAAATTGERDQEDADQRKCWVRCTKWDACAIGSLPGHPN